MNEEAKEEIRSRLAIEDVIGEYVDLKRAGRSLRGLSPFTNERTPSFFVSPEKNVWHDFSSNQGGDVYSFIMKVEGIGFKEALELLARKANVDLSMYQSAKSRDIAQKKQRFYKIHELAANFYQHQMIRSQAALEYIFKTRQISKDTVNAFKIGFAPEHGGLVDYLKRKKFSTKDLGEAGVTNRFGTDLFRGRMMVPLMDASGRVIGFTGRILKPNENSPKYINTSQTLIYNKSWHVFGLSQAKDAIRQHDYAVVVEGNMDAVSSWQAGVKQTVATAGTAMTVHHLKTIGRITKNIRLAYDGDAAGIAATERVIPIAQEAGIDLSIISMPAGAKDPDELVKQDPRLWQAAIDSAEPVIEWILNKYSSRYDITTARGKREYTNAGLAILNNISDPVIKDHYLQKMAQKIHSSTEVLLQKMKADQTKVVRPDKKPIKIQKTNPVKNDFELEDNLLALGCVSESVREVFKNQPAEIISDKTRQDFFEYLKTNPPQAEILQKDSDYGKMLLLRVESRFLLYSDDQKIIEAKQLLKRIKKEHSEIKKEKLNLELSQAEAAGDDEKVRELLEQIQLINKEIFSGK